MKKVLQLALLFGLVTAISCGSVWLSDYIESHSPRQTEKGCK